MGGTEREREREREREDEGVAVVVDAANHGNNLADATTTAEELGGGTS